MSSNGERRPRVLAVASGGGHWIQLLRIEPALRVGALLYATTDSSARGMRFRCCLLNDANRDTPLAMIRLAIRVARLVRRFRPDVVVSTGAAPGLIACAIARLCGARTLFLDSVANAEQPSLSARLASRFVDRALTSWPHLAQPENGRFRFEGSVL